MFQFGGFASVKTDTAPSVRWVAPFGHPRIIGRSRLPAAFRSLPRPSSPPGAKASPVRLTLLVTSLRLPQRPKPRGAEYPRSCSIVLLLFFPSEFSRFSSLAFFCLSFHPVKEPSAAFAAEWRSRGHPRRPPGRPSVRNRVGSL